MRLPGVFSSAPSFFPAAPFLPAAFFAGASTTASSSSPLDPPLVLSISSSSGAGSGTVGLFLYVTVGVAGPFPGVLVLADLGVSATMSWELSSGDTSAVQSRSFCSAFCVRGLLRTDDDFFVGAGVGVDFGMSSSSSSSSELDPESESEEDDSSAMVEGFAVFGVCSREGGRMGVDLSGSSCENETLLGFDSCEEVEGVCLRELRGAFAELRAGGGGMETDIA